MNNYYTELKGHLIRAPRSVDFSLFHQFFFFFGKLCNFTESLYCFGRGACGYVLIFCSIDMSQITEAYAVSQSLCYKFDKSCKYSKISKDFNINFELKLIINFIFNVIEHKITLQHNNNMNRISQWFFVLFSE